MPSCLLSCILKCFKKEVFSKRKDCASYKQTFYSLRSPPMSKEGNFLCVSSLASLPILHKYFSLYLQFGISFKFRFKTINQQRYLNIYPFFEDYFIQINQAKSDGKGNGQISETVLERAYKMFRYGKTGKIIWTSFLLLLLPISLQCVRTKERYPEKTTWPLAKRNCPPNKWTEGI